MKSSDTQNWIKIGASDPGKQRDSWGFVGIKVNRPYIQVIGAQRWLGKKYLSVEEKIAKIHFEFKYHYQVIEVNNVGLHAYEILKDVKKLPITGVVTGKDLSNDPRKKFIPYKFPVMDKNDMVRWLMIENEAGHLIFPENMTKELMELQTQISNIIEEHTPGGTIRYLAEGTSHDDLFMALLLDCWLARTRFLSGGMPVVASGRFNPYFDLETSEDRITTNMKERLKNINGFEITDLQIQMPGDNQF